MCTRESPTEAVPLSDSVKRCCSALFHDHTRALFWSGTVVKLVQPIWVFAVVRSDT